MLLIIYRQAVDIRSRTVIAESQGGACSLQHTMFSWTGPHIKLVLSVLSNHECKLIRQWLCNNTLCHNQYMLQCLLIQGSYLFTLMHNVAVCMQHCDVGCMCIVRMQHCMQVYMYMQHCTQGVSSIVRRVYVALYVRRCGMPNAFMLAHNIIRYKVCMVQYVVNGVYLVSTNQTMLIYFNSVPNVYLTPSLILLSHLRLAL